MALNFEKTLVVSTNQGATQSFLGQEHNGDLYKYYTKNNNIGTVSPRTVTEAVDQHTPIVLANYNNIDWSEVSKSLTSDYVDTIGIKTFPGIGAYGFWTLQGEARSKVLVPIHVNRTYTTPPTFTCPSTNFDVIPITIKQPKDIEYECFRIVLKESNFTLEYVTYDLETEIVPAYRGTYIVYIVGYAGEGSTVSEDSVQTTVQFLTRPKFNPTPYLDRYVDSIDYADDGKLRLHRSDKVTLVSPAYPKTIERASFLEDGTLTLSKHDESLITATNFANKVESLNFLQGGKLTIKFKDGSTLTTTNSAGEPDIQQLTDEDRDLTTYSIFKPNRAYIDITSDSGNNLILFAPIETDHSADNYKAEDVYKAFNVERDKDYKLTFKYKTTTGFVRSGVADNRFYVGTYPPVNHMWAGDVIGESANLNNLITSEPKEYTIEFNTGSYTTVYFILELDYILNDRTVGMEVNDICLYKLN